MQALVTMPALLLGQQKLSFDIRTFLELDKVAASLHP